VLYLLAACQKYEMTSVLPSIRAKVKLGEFPAPKGAEAFSAYAIASGKGLIPEMENAARQTLDHPMTFEVLGEGLRLFEGQALCDLAVFRKRCRDGLVACLDPFTIVNLSGHWVGCPKLMSVIFGPERNLFTWLRKLIIRNQKDLSSQSFTRSLDIHSRIRREYFTALQDHGKCNFCMGVHTTFCAELDNKLALARDKVTYSPP
jgi:hypothetical protein